jgi:hypothetical protein
MNFRDARFALVSEQFRMKIVTLVPLRLVLFHRDAMRVSPCVLTDAGDLPGNLYTRPAGFDGEAAVGYFRRDPGLRGLADGGELIAEIGVESVEPGGHGDDSRSAAVRNDVAVINVLHVGRFDERVVEIFVSRVERMSSPWRPQ